MTKTLLTLGVAALLAGAPAQAQETEIISTGESEEFSSNEGTAVFNSPLNVSLDFGALTFAQPDQVDAIGEDDTRFTTGVRLLFDFPDFGKESALRFGFVTGLNYARLGGLDTLGDDGDGSNLLMVPANFQLGLTPGGNFLVAVHAGATGLYRDEIGAIDLGRDDQFEIFPNVGANIGVGFGDTIGLTLRGDYTLTPADDILTGTLGVVFGIG